MSPNGACLVLLAACNGEQYLEEQFASILRQERVNVHLALSVDRCSRDETLGLAKALSSTHGQVSFIDHGIIFGDAASHFLWMIANVDLSSHEYVALSDQDDIWEPDHLVRAISAMKENGADCYSSDVVAFWEHTGKMRRIKKSYPQARFDHFFEAAGPGCTYVIRRDVMRDFQGFLRKHWDRASQVALHDWLIYAFCRVRGYRWLIDEYPSVRYRQHSANVLGANLGVSSMLARWERIRSGWYARQVRMIHDLVKECGPTGLSLERGFLIRNFWHLRRRPRDKFLVLAMMLAGMVP